MPNIKSAKKRVRVNEAKAARNRSKRSEMKTKIKNFHEAVEYGDREEADAAYKEAVKSVDKAVHHHLLHKNNAARKKSSMTIELNKME